MNVDLDQFLIFQHLVVHFFVLLISLETFLLFLAFGCLLTLNQ